MFFLFRIVCSWMIHHVLFLLSSYKFLRQFLHFILFRPYSFWIPIRTDILSIQFLVKDNKIMFTDYLTDLLAPVVTRCILEMLLSFLHSHVNSQKYSQTKVHSYTFLCHFFIDVLLPVKEKHFVRLIMNCIVYVRQK